jgi:hypothetical protein
VFGPSASSVRAAFRRILARESAREEPPAATEVDGQYARSVLALLADWEEFHNHWVAELQEMPPTERLANSAAIYHWRLYQVTERMQQIQAPGHLGSLHQAVVGSLAAASRATRIVSSGYRFHSVRRMCDGTRLLQQAHSAAASLREALEQLPAVRPSTPPEGSPLLG